MIPRYRNESKFYNSTNDEIINILEALSSTDTSIAIMIVDKHDYNSHYYGKYGNELYHMTLNELLKKSFEFIGPHDVCFLIDRSTFISLDDLRHTAYQLSLSYGCNLLRCEKVTSHQNKCIQLADYVAGSFFVNLEYGDDSFSTIIERKVIPAYRY